MKYFLIIFLICDPLEHVLAGTVNCWLTTKKREGTASFTCIGLTSLQNLDKAKSNTTSIQISDSTITNLPGHTFARFGATLVSLDLHESGIETIESQAFIGLTKLESLILWGNKLRWVPGDWFVNMYNLRTLDLSFNFIEGIDYNVFRMLPYLENFDFDYNQLKFIDFNMFGYLGNLKKVKFGKNPLSWPYRARLIWQFENQHVKYTEEWEDWAWMNVIIKECIETGQGQLPSDEVLDCVVGKLLDFTHEMFPEEMRQRTTGCSRETQRLVQCMRPKNSTGNSDNETVRRILENYTTVLISTTKSQSIFSTLASSANTNG